MNTIQTNTNYVVVKKQFSVHSEDRDIRNWPNPSCFEVSSPVDYKNVVSLKLNDIELPPTQYVFSELNQNIKLTFSIRAAIYHITITSGTYTPHQLANELNGQMNNAVSLFIAAPYAGFEIQYNTVTLKLMFVNTIDQFALHFICPDVYECAHSYFCNYTKWGLGSYLGFNKKEYLSQPKSIPLYWNLSDISGNYIEPEYPLLFKDDGQIYMELALYNSIDEIMPYAERSNQTYNAKSCGKHNSAFAKIPVDRMYHDALFNVFFSDPPLERIDRFKFKMRYHDGREVDFNHANYNFTIEVTMLKPDSIKPCIKVNSSNYNL
jgi:hypothetical protein